jgi:cyanophycinase-like exopeptidase
MTRITPGPVALLGGHEHRDGTEVIERTLLDQLGVAAPRVTVLPAAAPARQAGMVAALARTYWSRLGATVRIAMPDARQGEGERQRAGGRGSHEALDAVASADVIVLPGGVPNRLVNALGASPVWDLVVRRWRAGAALAGSSAGAMSLFAWRLRLYPPNPFALIPGLGLFDGWVAAPHFGRFRAERWATRVTRWFGGLGVLGLDEGTAIVGRDGRFTVVGSGALTVIAGDEMRVHRANAQVALDLHGPASGHAAAPAPSTPVHRPPARSATIWVPTDHTGRIRMPKMTGTRHAWTTERSHTGGCTRSASAGRPTRRPPR